MTNVIKVRFCREWDGNRPGGREYTYYTPVSVEAGDRVDIDTAHGVSQAVVTRVDVPVAEIARFGDKAKSIIGKTVESEERSRDEESPEYPEDLADGQRTLAMPESETNPWDWLEQAAGK